MTFYIATREDRFSPYLVESEDEHYGFAVLRKLTLKPNHYDAQVFSDPACQRRDLVYAHPRDPGVMSPYTRLYGLLEAYADSSSFRLLLARPSPGQGINFPRLFLFAYHHIDDIHYLSAHVIHLRREGEEVFRFDIEYPLGLSALSRDVRTHDEFVAQTFQRHARMDSIFVADVAEDFQLYFGYCEADLEDRRVVMGLNERIELLIIGGI